MYIYHTLIDALSAQIIHINLNMIFYTHVEHSPVKNNLLKVLYGNTHTHTHTHTHAHTAMNLNVYDTDQYHTSYMRERVCTYAHTHTHTLTMTVAETGY